MDKPRAFIHLYTGSYYQPAALVFGRFRLPLTVMFAGAGFIMGALILYGIIAGAVAGWAPGWSTNFIWTLWFVASFVGLWAVIGVVNLFGWMIRETRKANER